MEPRCGFESLERAPTARLSTNIRSQREVHVEPIRTLKAPLLILGMHRSGTSLLTDLLNELGLITGWSLNELQIIARKRERRERDDGADHVGEQEAFFSWTNRSR